jgi:hypothetical protein
MIGARKHQAHQFQDGLEKSLRLAQGRVEK